MARKNLLKGFKKPKSVTFEHLTDKPNYAKFTASPFETGFGTTIGNTLRRVLLSSIQGYAPTSIRITVYNADGTQTVISSEFEAIPGVSEDILEVINTLKLIRFKLSNPEIEDETILYSFKGERVVKSEDLAREGVLEVLTPGITVFTMMEDANFELEMQVSLGRGYVPSEVNQNYIEVVGTIPIDSIFTPVQKVKYSIEPCRVGERNDYDKLNLEVWTDGSISPEDALAEAAKIAKDHFSVFVNFNEDEISTGEEIDEDLKRIKQILNTPVEELELSVRSSNCLKNANIKTIGELTKKSEDDLGRTRNFGKKSLAEIKEKLQEWGLALGMTDYSHLKDLVNMPMRHVNNQTIEKEDADES